MDADPVVETADDYQTVHQKEVADPSAVVVRSVALPVEPAAVRLLAEERQVGLVVHRIVKRSETLDQIEEDPGVALGQSGAQTAEVYARIEAHPEEADRNEGHLAHGRSAADLLVDLWRREWFEACLHRELVPECPTNAEASRSHHGEIPRETLVSADPSRFRPCHPSQRSPKAPSLR